MVSARSLGRRLERAELAARSALQAGCDCELAAEIVVVRLAQDVPISSCPRCGSERDRIILPDNGRGAVDGYLYEVSTAPR